MIKREIHKIGNVCSESCLWIFCLKWIKQSTGRKYHTLYKVQIKKGWCMLQWYHLIPPWPQIKSWLLNWVQWDTDTAWANLYEYEWSSQAGIKHTRSALWKNRPIIERGCGNLWSSCLHQGQKKNVDIYYAIIMVWSHSHWDGSLWYCQV